ncbi:hypothetical protein D3C80_2013150 [compost metagenome]
MQRIDLLLQFGLQAQTSVEGTLQQGDPVFQTAGGHDGAIVAAEGHGTAAVTTEITHRCRRLRVQRH